MRDMPRGARAYVCAVICAGLAVVIMSATSHVDWAYVVILGLVYWFADSREIITRTGALGVSVGFPVALASLLILGTAGGALVCSVSALTFAHRAAWFKHIFNGAQAALSAAVAGVVYGAVPGAATHGFAHASFPEVLPAVIVAALTFFVAEQPIRSDRGVLDDRHLDTGRVVERFRRDDDPESWLRLDRADHGGALGRRRRPGGRVARAGAAGHRAVGVRAIQPAARGLRRDRQFADSSGRDEGLLHARSQRAGRVGVRH